MKTYRAKSKDSQINSIEGRKRVVIADIYPKLDCGLYPIKRTIGEPVHVEANIFIDGHDSICCKLLYRHESELDWQSTDLRLLNNDRWQATFLVEKLGSYFYTIVAMVDEFQSWLHAIRKKFDTNQVLELDLLTGQDLINKVYPTIDPKLKLQCKNLIKNIVKKNDLNSVFNFLELNFVEFNQKYSDPALVTRYNLELEVTVDRKRANYGAWYELFPRTWLNEKNSSILDLKSYLNYIKDMGFNVIYLAPIHPIGLKNRKGKNNSISANNNDPGSPWAIGNSEGGHMSLHPQLGTYTDFKAFVKYAKQLGLEVAMDFALQCSPDHPYLKEHPEWFKKRADGSLQYAENPPKKYEDIYPFNFESENWKPLWQECKKIILFWVRLGVRIFRVDNPHTKPFIFWEWLIKEIKKKDKEVIFLAEAFTRPSLMYQLAKIGFTQSYTYFTWRNTKAEITEYMQELMAQPLCDYFRPNFWPNTPDILSKYLQEGGRPAFIIRFILAATLATNYGIYGPAFELCDNIALSSDSEEYRDSEKYEIKKWDVNLTDNIKDVITKVNRIRDENSALHNMYSLRFHKTNNSEIICYSKHDIENQNIILVVVNLDYKNTQSAIIEAPIEALANMAGIRTISYEVHDLLNDKKYTWKSNNNYVELNPQNTQAHIFRINYK